MSELKPCPFCGCGHQIDIDEEGGVAFVHQNYNWSKDDCILSIQELDYPEKIDEFVRKWNARPIEDTLRAENEKLLKVLETIANITGVLHVSYISKYAQQALNEVTNE